MNRLYWKAISKPERIESINDISSLISQYGFISEFKRFSDISLSLIIEISGCNIPELTKKLRTLTDLDDGNDFATRETEQYLILLHLSFADGMGNLHIDVPDVPG